MSAKLRVMIDGINLGLESGTGVATYARNLSYCIGAMGHQTEVLYGTDIGGSFRDLLKEIYFFDNRQRDPDPFLIKLIRQIIDGLSPFSARARPVPITGQVIIKHFNSRLPHFDTLLTSPRVFERAAAWFAVSQYFLGTRLSVGIRRTPDIAHWTYPLPLKISGAKNIYTFHDLVPLRLPFTTLDQKRYYLKLASVLASRADHIVTVSETSRKDIINLLGIPEHRVTNTYQSVEIPAKYADKSPDIVKDEIEGLLNLDYKNYFMYFGAIEPKKNIGRMIEAYIASNCRTPLLIVGKQGWKSEQELKLAEYDANNYLETIGRNIYTRRQIIRIDYVPFSLLVSLIKGAKAVLFPSLYEGFGLPALEAMKLGTPVITSTGGAMPEIVGDAAVKVDPYDTRALANAIQAVDKNEELRRELSAKGFKRAAEFSPEAHQKRLSEVYNKVMKSNIL